jgi:hypothetical protein
MPPEGRPVPVVRRRFGSFHHFTLEVLMSTVAFDCTKFPKTQLKAMLEDKSGVFDHLKPVIKAFLEPKPKDYAPVEGKVSWRAKTSTMSTTRYPKGYIRLELNQGNGCLYKNAVEELIAHLQAELANLSDRPKA